MLHYGELTYNEGIKKLNGIRIVFLTNGTRTNGYPHAK